MAVRVRKKLPVRVPKWRPHLERGEHRSAVFKALLTEFSGNWGHWADLDLGSLRRRMVVHAEAFCREHAIHPDWARPDSSPIRRALRYTIYTAAHLGHREFNRPTRGRWREDPGRWKVRGGLRVVEQEVKARLAAKGRNLAAYNLLRAAAAQHEMLLVHDLHHRQGLSVRQIREDLGMAETTVRRHLKLPFDPSQTP